MTITNDGLPEGKDPWKGADDKPNALDLPGLLPDEFFKERTWLTHVQEAAWSSACSRDVTFLATMARESGMLSPHIRAITGISGPASLNIFGAPVGPPGTGKSTSAGLAEEICICDDEKFLDGLPIGSGEGISELYMGVVDKQVGEVEYGKRRGDPIIKSVREQTKHNMYMYVDEGGVLDELRQRSGGSTLADTLRSAAMGQTIGQSNATEDRRRLVKKGTYSFGLIIGFQECTARPLLADAGTGTPQRFFWCWAQDPNIPEVPPKWPGPLKYHPGMARPTQATYVQFPDRIKKMLWAERLGRNRGELEVGVLDGHANLMKVKMAAMFALFEKRRLVDEDDWRLAGIVWEHSCKVRDTLVAAARREVERARQVEEDAVVHLAVRTHEAKNNVDRNLERIARRIHRLVVKATRDAPGGMTWGAIRRDLASTDRPLIEQAVALAVSMGLVVEDGDHICLPIED